MMETDITNPVVLDVNRLVTRFHTEEVCCMPSTACRCMYTRARRLVSWAKAAAGRA